MTGKMNASLIQFDAKVLEPELNLTRMQAAIRAEAKGGAQLIVFPELSNTGYVEPLTPGAPFSPESGGAEQYAFRLFQAAEPRNGPFIRSLCDLAREHSLHVIVGLALRHPGQQGVMHNASVLISPDGVLGTYHKIHRWHLEKLYFIAGDSISVQQTMLGPIGMQVCYDIRFPELTRALMLKGAQIVTNIWASFRPHDKPLEDDQIFTHRAYTRATENGVFFLSCNRAGRQGHCAFMGRSVIVAPEGKVLAQSSSEDEDVVRAELDLDDVARYRSYVGIATDRRADIYAQYLTMSV